jgi:phenylacetate-CoA ligase
LKPGKNFYDALPVWAQTIAVNAASARNWRTRYGPPFAVILERLTRNERKSRDELLADQQAATRRLLRHALDRVPYYRALKCSPDNLRDWPILTKAIIAAQPDQFLSDEFSTRDLLETHTSGTTGSPLTVRFTPDCHKTEMAFRWRHQAWGGAPFLSRSAFVAGHPVVPPHQQRPPFWRWDRVEKRLLCSSYHLAPQNLPSYLEAFRRYAPDFIRGYPSSLYLLAHVGGYQPKAVFTSSETLLDFQRAAIERGFGAKVFNWYGNTEMTCNIVECAAGNLHYRTDYGVLELLDDGTMICTGLNNPAMPLIRYRVGDRAFAKAGDCPCGCAFPLIERVEGRIEDYIRTADGRFVGRLDHLFKDARGVREAQIVQTRLDEIVIRVVKEDGFDEKPVLAEARQRLGDGVAVRFEYVNLIERTPAGKFRFIVSQLPREQLELPPS